MASAAVGASIGYIALGVFVHLQFFWGLYLAHWTLEDSHTDDAASVEEIVASSETEHYPSLYLPCEVMKAAAVFVFVGGWGFGVCKTLAPLFWL